MAARTLKHYSANNPAGANTVFDVMGAAVPAARALVGRVVAASSGAVGTSQVVAVFVGAAASSAAVVAYNLTMNAGDIYEQQVVILAGERVYCRTSDATATDLTVHVMGEEVDN